MTLPDRLNGADIRKLEAERLAKAEEPETATSDIVEAEADLLNADVDPEPESETELDSADLDPNFDAERED